MTSRTSDDPEHRPTDGDREQRHAYARALCQLGLEQIQAGHAEDAIKTFDESLAILPTAEGHTYRGWAWSLRGQLERAIAECMRAIRIDPDFGNPYNDIGVYLMQLGRLDEAVSWLESAKRARRYQPRHFPYLNRGHIYMLEGREARALDEFMRALELDPGNEIALGAIAEMDMADF